MQNRNTNTNMDKFNIQDRDAFNSFQRSVGDIINAGRKK